MWIFHYLLLSGWTLLPRKAQNPEHFNMNKSIMSTNITLCLECFKDCLYLTKFMIVFPYFSFLVSCWALHPCPSKTVEHSSSSLAMQGSQAVLPLTKTHFYHYHFNKEYDYWSSSNAKSLLHCGFWAWGFLVYLFFGFLKETKGLKELVLFPVPTFKKLLAAFLERE